MYTTSGSATEPLLPVIQGAHAPAYLTWRAFGARLASALLIVTTSCVASHEVWLPPSDDTPPPLFWPFLAFTALAAALVITEAVAMCNHRKTYDHGVHDGESASGAALDRCRKREERTQANLDRALATTAVLQAAEKRRKGKARVEQRKKRIATLKARVVSRHRRRCPDRAWIWKCPHTQTYIASQQSKAIDRRANTWRHFGEQLVKRRAAKKEKDLSATRLTPRS